MIHVFFGTEISVFIFGGHCERGQKFNVGFLVDIVEEKFLKLCVIMTLLRLQQLKPNLMTLTLFQGHTFARIINCKCF